MTRYKPYTVDGIKRVPCKRCGAPATQQWNICSLGKVFHAMCSDCDYKLNELVLKFVGITNFEAKLKAYKARLSKL